VIDMAIFRLLPVVSACLVVGVALLAAGCGGDTRRAESETGGIATQPAPIPTTPSTGRAPVVSAGVKDPVRRAYISRVDRVCGQLDPERNATRERVGSAADPGEAAKAYDEGTAVGSRQLRQLEAIPPPPGDGGALRANLFGPIATQLALRRQIRDALAAVDVARLRQLRAQLDNLTRTVVGFARGYGFRSCGAG
jgi:hypothetical protein